MFVKYSKKTLRTLKLILAITLILLSIAYTASASVGPRANTADDPVNGIYVSPTGNDSTATGAISAPYKSINAALAAARSGDTIILRGGTYREGINVRIRTPNITIKSSKGEWAVIDLTTYNSGHNEDSGVYFDVDSSGGKLQFVEVMGGFYAVCMETKWDWGQPDRSGASNIIIEDCILHDSRYDVVKVKPNCDNITIRYNEIYNSGRAFPNSAHRGDENAEGIDNVNGNNMTVQNNYIHDIISNAIYAKGGARDVLIENNWIELAYGAGIMVGFDASPEFFDLTVNPQYYENIRGVVRNNLIIDTGWEGIGLYAAKDAQIYNNTLVNVNNGGLYHSAIYFGVTMQDWESYAGRPSSVNPNIHHNIVCQPANFTRQMIEIRFANELGGLLALDGNPVMNNNCYFIIGKNAAFTDNRPGSKLQNARLSAWQAHISGDSGSLEVDPALNADYIATNPQCAGMGISGFSAPQPVPGAPTGVSAIAGNGQATVTFTAPANNGSPITSYTVTARPGGITATGASSPITVTGLTNGTSYTFTVTATNSVGTGPASTASSSVTPTSGGGNGGGGGENYSFNNLEGEWTLISGSGNFTGNYEGKPFTGVATPRIGKANISNMRDLGNGTASGNISMTSEWRIIINVSGFESITENFHIGGTAQLLRQIGPNVFIYDYAESYSGFSDVGNVEITLTSSTTANVTQRGESIEPGGSMNYEFRYFVRKQSSDNNSNGKSGGGCNASGGLFGILVLAGFWRRGARTK
ncbi:MAG: fibronectin type III domain-containing protein [Synergistaceae bacterium]|nr:fibronectin type III domain-containing protein [Synergistaceae bacterium]